MARIPFFSKQQQQGSETTSTGTAEGTTRTKFGLPTLLYHHTTKDVGKEEGEGGMMAGNAATTDYSLQGGGRQGVGQGITMEGMRSAASYTGHQAAKIAANVQEGPVSFRLIAFIGAVLMVVTSVLDFLGGVLQIKFTHVLVAVFVCTFAIIICILEGRSYLPPAIVEYQTLLFVHAKFLRFITGRGVFYFFAGLLQFSNWSFLNMISGLYMMCVGIMYVVVGRATGRKLAAVRAAIRDETALQVAFADSDSDGDGYLTQEDFDRMIEQLDDVDLSHNELIAAFTAIDEDDDGKVSFDDFRRWWSGHDATEAVIV